MALPLVSAPTKNAVIGVFEGDGVSDIFQILSKDGSVAVHMNSAGIIDPPVYPRLFSTTITSAQLLNLHNASVVVVPSPGPGFIIVPEQISLVYHYGGAPYVVTGSDGFMYFNWSGITISSNSPNSFPEAGFIDATSSQLSAAAGAAAVALGSVINKDLVFGIVDSLSGGNGNITVVVSYVVLPA